MAQGQQRCAATHIVFCIETTAATAKGWAQDRELYIDPLLHAIEGGKLGRCRMACVLYGTNSLYR